VAKDWSALFKASLVAALLLGAALGMRELDFAEPSVGVFTLLCGAFLIVFAITSNRLLRLDGPAGFSATFRDYLDDDARLSSSVQIGEAVPANVLFAIRKGGLDELPSAVRNLRPDQHAAIVLKVGERYDSQALAAYEREILRKAKSATVVVVGRDGQFIGSLRPADRTRPTYWRRRPMPDDEPNEGRTDPYSRLLGALADGIDNPSSPELSVLNTESFPDSLSRKKALEFFAKQNTRYLVLTDNSGRPQSIVFKDELLLEFIKQIELVK
jgi:hypothetical protein